MRCLTVTAELSALSEYNHRVMIRVPLSLLVERMRNPECGIRYAVEQVKASMMGVLGVLVKLRHYKDGELGRIHETGMHNYLIAARVMRSIMSHQTPHQTP